MTSLYEAEYFIMRSLRQLLDDVEQLLVFGTQLPQLRHDHEEAREELDVVGVVAIDLVTQGVDDCLL